MDCRADMVPKIERDMLAFMERMYGKQLPPIDQFPFWVRSSLRQHAEYAANDYCAMRGLQGLGGCAELPSSTAASDLLDGKPGALMDVTVSVILRGGLIAAGLYLAGERKNLVKYSAAAALAIEAFVLSYIAYNRRK